MKKYKNIILTLLLVLSALQQVEGQEAFGDLKDSILGHWQADMPSLKASMQGDRHASYNALPSEAREDIERALASREFFFFSDGVFVAQWTIGGKPNSVRGSWGTVEKGRLFIEVQERRSEYLVHGNGDDKMVLIPQRERSSLVHELYFTRKEEE